MQLAKEKEQKDKQRSTESINFCNISLSVASQFKE
jgi:hypothetical protein